MNLKEQTSKELKRMFRSLYDTIYVVECYGVNDMLLLNAIGEELEYRGIDIDIQNNDKIKFNSMGE